MSVINKMHHDIREAQKDGPVIGGIPNHSRSKKIIIAIFIVLLILSSITFATLIFNKKREVSEQVTVQIVDNHLTSQNERVKVIEPLSATPEKDSIVIPKEEVVPEKGSIVIPKEEVVLEKDSIVIPKQEVIQQITSQDQSRLSVPSTVITLPEKKQTIAPVAKKNRELVNLEIPLPSPEIITQNVSGGDSQVIETQSSDFILSDDSTLIEKSSQGVLEIKDAQLTNAQLARIKLKEAQSAEDEGELNKAADKREQALRFDPSLNDVRKSLSLYFYGTGNVTKAKQLLQTGAVISPDYSEFNLMLSRIALKEGDSQKAYLYLNQHPPVVSGHLDYYVSYAILAQKFQKYEQSERLYSNLLSERPDNGRWLMSLAIAQDKQSKIVLAVNNYKRALLKPDLSSKAKAYINQRIAYLENKQ